MPGTLPISLAAVGVCDRLATEVVQQLTQRSWQHARRVVPGRLTSRDVTDTIRAPGTFDFLHHANVLGRASADDIEPR